MGDLDLFQNDARWKDTPLGFATDGNSTIGLFGCLLTSLAIVANHYGADETPATLNEKMKAAGAFQGPWVRAFQLHLAVPGVRFTRSVECYNDVPAPLADIDAYLAAGKPVIVEVDYAPDPGVQNHWIVLYAKQGDDYLMRDPWKGAKSGQTLRQKYGFAGEPVMLINRVMWFDASGAAPAPTPSTPSRSAPAPIPANPPATGSGLTVMALADGLTFRRAPVIAESNVIRRLSANTKLQALDADADKQVGVQNQWLKVRDLAGQEGFVAAWLVTRADEPALGARPATTERPTPVTTLTVRTIQDQVTLRTQPVIADNTVLKRVPLNTELLVTEANAEGKIGTQNQWLRVRDLGGPECFVAAWLVRRVLAGQQRAA